MKSRIRQSETLGQDAAPAEASANPAESSTEMFLVGLKGNQSLNVGCTRKEHDLGNTAQPASG